MDSEPMLRVTGLTTHIATPDGLVRAVEDMSFELRRGETLGIVGESGCGKSVTAMSVLRLLATPPARVVSGAVDFMGRDLLGLPESEMRLIRGNDIAMIFQEPMTSLNPVMTVGDQISEPALMHLSLTPAEARARAIDMLKLVQIPEPERRFDEYPHQLSGGMRQRVMIAMALICNPKVLIADEPTTALDVTIQAQILELIADLKARLGMAIILITHDLGVVAETCDRVIVMYAGRKVEEADVDQLFNAPLHPYMSGLMAAAPRLKGDAGSKLNDIPGSLPSPLAWPPGCRFAPRCPLAMDICRASEPPLVRHGSDHSVACFAAEKGIAQ